MPPASPTPHGVSKLTRRATEVVQGAHEVGKGQDTDLVATLGSCVAVCLYDPAGQVGGMTHIYRHVTGSALGDAALVAEIETLVNSMMHRGSNRAALKAKVTGGAHVLGFGGASTAKRHGQAMADAALRYLEAEDIPVTGISVGGEVARRIRFQPWDGELFVNYVKSIVPEEPKEAVADPGNAPELF